MADYKLNKHEFDAINMEVGYNFRKKAKISQITIYFSDRNDCRQGRNLEYDL
jgi:hypothetical protein